ncbi:MAG TPA: BMP family ABC transporter substrate-binding protein [Alphaproteobacteria bacterium]|nr:BMP family ABC transporter substrate-binding protein [Alphaproteobacteria bacterium]
MRLYMPRQCTTRPCAGLVRIVVLAVLACGAIGGCSAEEPAEDRFRVALLTPGSIADGGWNAGAYAGLELIRDELGAEISHVETRTPAEFEESFRDYASRGYDLVFGHGFEYQDAAAAVGATHPDTVFVTTSGNTVRENVAPMVFELEQATYLCGYLAGRMTATGKLGMIGGINLPSIRSTFVAFRAGALAARPDAVVREVFIGNFDDTAATREAALALLEEGADFLIHQANEAGRGVFQAVSERVAAGQRAFAFGTNRNQNDMAPDVVIASATLDIPGALLEVARRVQAGEFVAAPIRLGMAEGIVRLEINPRLAPRIPDDVRADLAAREAELLDGSLAVPRGAF